MAVIRTPEEVIIQAKGIQAFQESIFNFSEIESDIPIATSVLGTPIFSNLVFEGGSYIDDDGIQVFYPGLRIDSVLYTITQPKQIVKTKVQGRRGTVKEYVSDGDFQILIEGAIVSGFSDLYPEEAMDALKQILFVPEKLRVQSDLLQLFDIDDIVVESYDMPQTKGYRDSQFFKIRALSDDPDELIVTDVRGSTLDG